MGDEKDIVKQVQMPIGEIVIFPITNEELDQIEQGGPSSTIFGVMLSLLSLGLGGFFSLLLAGPAPKDPPLRYIIAIVMIAVTVIVGVVLLVIWWRMPNPVKAVIAKVRKRDSPPPPVERPVGSPTPGPVQVQGGSASAPVIPIVQVNNVIETERKP